MSTKGNGSKRPSMVEIRPSLLSADFAHLGRDARRALEAGADALHGDVMDGRFVPPITFGADVIGAVIRETGATVDVHLMIEHPEEQIEAFADAGVRGITVHVETCPHLHRVLGSIRDAGCEAGVALNPHTPVTETLRYVMPLLDRVLIMSVNPGWGGQAFIPDALDKVHKVARLAEASARDLRIQVDGGVNPQTAVDLVKHGATELVAGSAVYKGDVEANVAALREAIHKALSA